MPTKPSEGKLLYHITHVNNMQSILNSGLMSRQQLLTMGSSFFDIADPEIIARRIEYKNNLSNYILFHFFSKNPFDCAVCRKYGKENMVIITIDRELHNDYDFYIIPTHPLDVNNPDIYSYNDGYPLIQWNILDMQTNRDYNCPEIKKACMAECLVKDIIKPEAFSYLYVYNDETKIQISRMTNQEKIRITVNSNMFPSENNFML